MSKATDMYFTFESYDEIETGHLLYIACTVQKAFCGLRVGDKVCSIGINYLTGVVTIPSGEGSETTGVIHMTIQKGE